MSNIGTIIHGTLRPEDLIPAFLDALQERDKAEADKLRDRYSEVIAAVDRGELDHLDRQGHSLMEQVDWLLNEDLYYALNDLAPEGTRFGAHEGDGSDFGFWPIEEEW